MQDALDYTARGSRKAGQGLPGCVVLIIKRDSGMKIYLSHESTVEVTRT